jgi:hypothetical protein
MDDETTRETQETNDEAWKTAKIVGTEEEASLVIGFLNNNGIEAQAESLHASEFPTDFGPLGEVHVMVPAGQLAEAQQLLEKIDAETAVPAAEGDGE